ncbi:hypothetical protein [Kineococcus sp. R86509]|uniref:hypothetical protein n=1 Tax=Kineococcus sp. R86509 TaxID=3093851 RepID=UPI0036D434D0
MTPVTNEDQRRAATFLAWIYRDPERDLATDIVEAVLAQVSETQRVEHFIAGLVVVIADLYPDIQTPEAHQRLQELAERYALAGLDQ